MKNNVRQRKAAYFFLEDESGRTEKVGNGKRK